MAFPKSFPKIGRVQNIANIAVNILCAGEKKASFYNWTIF
jgi:hypothetical protein